MVGRASMKIDSSRRSPERVRIIIAVANLVNRSHAALREQQSTNETMSPFQGFCCFLPIESVGSHPRLGATAPRAALTIDSLCQRRTDSNTPTIPPDVLRP
jgi:hypothetical protein